MFTYNSLHPRLLRDGKPIVGAPLYSGYGPGLNNPAMEAVPDIGPIPAGEWQIMVWHDHYEDKGPCVAQLEPVGHNAHGRTGFLIHGDNAAQNHTASHGCIIAGPSIRAAMREAGDTDLIVTSGEQT